MSTIRRLLVVVHTVEKTEFDCSALATQIAMKNERTRKTASKSTGDRMRPSYDFSGGMRGKYVERYQRGSNVVLLDPEVAAPFPDSAAVNDALRALLAIAKRTQAT